MVILRLSKKYFSDASLRGTLCTITQLFLSIGVTGLYALGAIVDWRVAALICLCAPVATMLLAVIVVSINSYSSYIFSQVKESGVENRLNAMQ